ncbi:hypothetical protein LTR36_009898 [Oleoguttula mirabilis]|uniref:Uncharacterized protein n=1 Tax=Oleoguttula mirabilis TaxID=1507867 RepID=A0AAV9J5N6_9PEZI|nr:hypothetical protein LTR36_009898 [Oleoguttula mirabilis]
MSSTNATLQAKAKSLTEQIREQIMRKKSETSGTSYDDPQKGRLSKRKRQDGDEEPSPEQVIGIGLLEASSESERSIRPKKRSRSSHLPDSDVRSVVSASDSVDDAMVKKKKSLICLLAAIKELQDNARDKTSQATNTNTTPPAGKTPTQPAPPGKQPNMNGDNKNGGNQNGSKKNNNGGGARKNQAAALRVKPTLHHFKKVTIAANQKPVQCKGPLCWDDPVHGLLTHYYFQCERCSLKVCSNCRRILVGEGRRCALGG